MVNLVHIGIHNSLNKNSGDTLLFQTVRDLFDNQISNINWQLRQVWDQFDEKVAKEVNKSSDGLVIGGGGLFLCDQDGANIENSGWQWNSDLKSLEELQIPIIVYAIGYNRFRNQREFPNIFNQHLNKLFKKADFVGLRNNGSIDAIKNYVNASIHQKIVLQYCPTMCLWQLNKKCSFEFSKKKKYNRKRLAINMAFDREGLRFKSNKVRILRKVAESIKFAEKSGWQINLVAHKDMDLEFKVYLDDLKINYKIINLTNSSSEEIVHFYLNIDFVIGMRGHSQMIPFGLRKPILSLISHDKMSFLLQDIKRTNWGLEINSENLTQGIIHKLSHFENNQEEWINDVSNLQQEVWDKSLINMQLIKNKLMKNK